jgi:hypothetical protein
MAWASAVPGRRSKRRALDEATPTSGYAVRFAPAAHEQCARASREVRTLNRLKVISAKLQGRGSYLEIGVRAGAVFWHIKARTRVGVDPAFIGRKLAAGVATTTLKRALGLRSGTLLFSATSDVFFSKHVERMQFDCVLIDGLHTADQAHRDVENALNCLSPDGLIVMHDCNPQTATAALPSLRAAAAQADFSGLWNGDVWRAVLRLRTRPDLEVSVLDCDQGLGIIRRGVPKHPLAEDEIDDLSYEDLTADRVRLLNLVAP